jgi:hypothetical protein
MLELLFCERWNDGARRKTLVERIEEIQRPRSLTGRAVDVGGSGGHVQHSAAMIDDEIVKATATYQVIVRAGDATGQLRSQAQVLGA